MTIARSAVPQSEAPSEVRELYKTSLGRLLLGQIEDALVGPRLQNVIGKVDLLFTSPPFPLTRKKKYGNRNGEEYLEWLKSLAPRLRDLLSPTGSLVIEIGNAWEPGSPTMSTLPLRALLAFQESAGLTLCQHVICHNPARLPTPAQWVTVDRVRLKDSFTHVWWLANSATPKADNSKVLTPYSDSMKSLLKAKRYNSGLRPSGHRISEKGFLKDHGGAIAPSVLDLSSEVEPPPSVLRFSNTAWDVDYVDYCKNNGLEAHPARMRAGLVAFFIEFLTDPGDLVFDPFAGSNTTGAVAEQLKRAWIAVEAHAPYAEGSKGRFDKFLPAAKGGKAE